MSRPEKTEYGEWYTDYISLVPEDDIVTALAAQVGELQEVCRKISENQGLYAYAEGKWTVKEVLGHLNDGERIFAYRALRIARGDKTPLPGFEQNDYVASGHFDERTVADLIEEFALLRRSNIMLFKSLADEAWLRIGTASENPVSVRAIAYIMVGHVRHHAKILKTRYLL